MIEVQRVRVDRGLFIDAVDLGAGTGHRAWWPETYQVYTLDGDPVTESYRGRGVVVDREGERYLMLGDPYTSPRLDEYRLADEPTTLTGDEPREREEFREGFAAGTAPSRKRRRPNASHRWRQGWEAGRRAIGREP